MPGSPLREIRRPITKPREGNASGTLKVDQSAQTSPITWSDCRLQEVEHDVQQPNHRVEQQRRSSATDITASTGAELGIIKSNLERDLRRGLGEKFDGRPELFRPWKSKMQYYIDRADCDARVTMDILVQNTAGVPRDVVQNILATEASPEEQVSRVWQHLCRRYGQDGHVSESLLNKLEAFKKISSPDNR